jgi:hypothetical protein
MAQASVTVELSGLDQFRRLVTFATDVIEHAAETGDEELMDMADRLRDDVEELNRLDRGENGSDETLR